jgi:hypothetical protein
MMEVGRTGGGATEKAVRGSMSEVGSPEAAKVRKTFDQML